MESCSLHLFSSLSNGCSDQFGVDCLNLGDFLDDFWNCFFSLVEVVVNRVANEENRLDVLQRLQLGKFIPRLDLVVADEKGMKSNAWLQIKLLNVVVGNPELLECLTNVFQSLESPDLVTAE